MPLPTFKTLEEIPEAFRTEYEEKDGAFVPKSTPGPDVAGLTSALEKERQKARDEEKARKLAEKERDDLKRTKEAREKGISEEELQKIREDEAKARKPIEDELAATKAENRKLKLTDQVQALYLKNGGMSDRVEDAMDQLAKRTDLGDAGGIVFKGSDGSVTADDAATFFKKFATEKPWLFEGTGSSGSGSGGSSGGAPPAKPDQKKLIDQKRADMGGF